MTANSPLTADTYISPEAERRAERPAPGLSLESWQPLDQSDVPIASGSADVWRA